MPERTRSSIIRRTNLGVIALMIATSGCSSDVEPPRPDAQNAARASERHQASQNPEERATSEQLTNPPTAISSDESKHRIDSQSETRKFAYVMFQYQRLLACGERNTQQSLPLTEAELQKLNEPIREATEAWKSVQSRSVPPEEFFDRFLPRAKQFETLVGETLTIEKREALLPALIQEHRGAIVFLLPEIPEVIGLTEEQLIEIEKMVDKTAKQFDMSKISILQIPKLLRLCAENRAQAEGMMNESQLSKWKALRD